MQFDVKCNRLFLKKVDFPSIDPESDLFIGSKITMSVPPPLPPPCLCL